MTREQMILNRDHAKNEIDRIDAEYKDVQKFMAQISTTMLSPTLILQLQSATNTINSLWAQRLYQVGIWQTLTRAIGTI